MSSWTDRINDHIVLQRMQELGPAIDGALAREDVDPPTLEGLERIRAVLTFAGKRLGGADPQLVHPASLDAMAGGLEQTTAEIKAYTADGVASHIVAANSHADTILGSLPAINYPFVADDWTALRGAGNAYRDDMEQALANMHARFSSIRSNSEELQQHLAQLGAALQSEQAKLAAVTADFQAQFAKEQETRNKAFAEQVEAALTQIRSDSTTIQQRLTELGTEIAAERAKLTTVATEFQSQFSAAQESRSRDFAGTQTNRQDTFAKIIADYNQRLTDQDAAFSKQRDEAFQKYEVNVAELNKKYAESAKDIVDRIESDKVAVEKLVGVIGNLGVTSGYLTAANYARKMTVRWQATAVAAMLGLIVFAYKAFLPLMQGTFNWETFAGRVFLTLTVGVLAAYAANQGDKYLRIEQRNRKLALELEAIGPYISPLPIEKQEQFRLQVGERTFGRDDAEVHHKIDKSPASVLDLLKDDENVNIVVKVVKAALKKSP